ncbi:hypothetical protein H0H87_003853 [Tephrocybe sp. NHM501043]|nr:hypothetical protein H0H87_003853 [Tephrocybe sp. NHM501043]
MRRPSDPTESRIYDASSDSMNQVFPSTSTYNRGTIQPTSLAFATQDANCPSRSSVVFPVSLSSSSWSSHPSLDPVSPISFSSPTSSNNALPSRSSYHDQGYCPSLEYSSSPSWETSFGSHLGGFDPSRAESDLLLVRRPQMVNPSQSQPLNTFDAQDNNLSSTELDISTIPMLTTLSLPGSPDISLDTSRHSSLGHGHHTRTGTVSPLDLGGTPTQDSSLYSSPHPSGSGTAVLDFPSPPLSLSPFITAPPPDSPIIQMNSALANSSTVEYASAVVSSAWGADVSVYPNYPAVNLLPRISLSSNTSQTRYEHPRPRPEHSGRTMVTIMTRIKALGRKMKKLISITSNATTKRSATEKETKDYTGPSASGTEATLLDDLDAPMVTGLPAEDSFMSIEDNCQDNTRTLEIEARPKTLAEIKSKRRLSLSILSGTSRSVSQPTSSIVAVARTRSRPRSAIILTATSPSSIADEDRIYGGHSSTSAPIPVEENERCLVLTTAPTSATIPTMLLNGTNKKQHRRFSLSALSHLVKSA